MFFSCCDPGSEAESNARGRKQPSWKKFKVRSAPIPIGKSIGFRSGLGFLRFSTDFVFSCCDPGSEAESNARGETEPPLMKFAFGFIVLDSYWKINKFSIGFPVSAFFHNLCFLVV